MILLVSSDVWSSFNYIFQIIIPAVNQFQIQIMKKITDNVRFTYFNIIQNNLTTKFFLNSDMNLTPSCTVGGNFVKQYIKLKKEENVKHEIETSNINLCSQKLSSICFIPKKSIFVSNLNISPMYKAEDKVQQLRQLIKVKSMSSLSPKPSARHDTKKKFQKLKQILNIKSIKDSSLKLYTKHDSTNKVQDLKQFLNLKFLNGQSVNSSARHDFKNRAQELRKCQNTKSINDSNLNLYTRHDLNNEVQEHRQFLSVNCLMISFISAFDCCDFMNHIYEKSCMLSNFQCLIFAIESNQGSTLAQTKLPVSQKVIPVNKSMQYICSLNSNVYICWLISSDDILYFHIDKFLKKFNESLIQISVLEMIKSDNLKRSNIYPTIKSNFAKEIHSNQSSQIITIICKSQLIMKSSVKLNSEPIVSGSFGNMRIPRKLNLTDAFFILEHKTSAVVRKLELLLLYAGHKDLTGFLTDFCLSTKDYPYKLTYKKAQQLKMEEDMHREGNCHKSSKYRINDKLGSTCNSTFLALIYSWSFHPRYTNSIILDFTRREIIKTVVFRL